MLARLLAVLLACAARADTARRLELQVFNDTGLPLVLGEVTTNGIWSPDGRAEPKQPLSTARSTIFVLAPRRPGQGAAATIMVEGPSKSFAVLDLSLPTIGAASVKTKVGGAVYAATPKEISREGGRWVFSLSLAATRPEARKAKKHQPSWRDDLTAEAVREIDNALQRGRAKARTCFTVFDSPFVDPIRLVLRIDGEKGRVESAEVLEPYNNGGVEKCLARAFENESVLPFLGRRSVPVSFDRPGNPGVAPIE